jgi:homoserine O-acetyltransferase/O-succinyltransferase
MPVRTRWTAILSSMIMTAIIGLGLSPTAAGAAELNQVRKQQFTTQGFRLANGAVLPELTLAYETYGTLAPDGRNAVLVAHGFTSSHHMAGRYAPDDAKAGSWDGLIGPGKAIDTDRLFVVSSNMLGSSYGSTNPASRNPATGKPYGPDFPDISVVDIVAAQKALLDHLGVKHLVAVAGPSYGGYQAFQWAVTFPDFMTGIAVAVSAPKSQSGPEALSNLVARLATDPNWNGGRYYDRGGVTAVMTEMRIATLKQYGIEAQLQDRFPDPAARETEIRRQAALWATEFDANGMVALRRAAIRFDAEKDFSKLRAKVLYVLCTTDRLFPPAIAPSVMDKLKAAGVDARFYELKSALGHSASGLDAAMWAPELKAFMAQVAPPAS